MAESGLDAVRINLSHGDHEQHQHALRMTKSTAEASGRPIGVLVDLSGPKVRLGELPDGEIEVEPGDGLILDPAGERGIGVTHGGLADDLDPGDALLLADGTVELKVISSTDVVETEVIRGGVLRTRTGVNVPSHKLSLPPVTEKDRRDIESFGVTNADWIAQSFVRNAADISELRQIVGKDVRIVAKIETGSAVDDADAIIDTADAIMVARGDLGVEIPYEEIPGVQKELVRKAGDAGKPVIVATQMLESMVEAQRPTRAEATDVANAVFEGADAIMLSAETAIGSYPVEAVAAAAKIAAAAGRRGIPARDRRMQRPTTEAHAIAQAASLMASQDPDIAAISCFTSSGSTADLLSSVRPGIPIYAFSDSQHVVDALTIRRAIVPATCDHPRDTDEMISIMERRLREAGLEEGTKVLMAASIPVGEAPTNMIKTHRL